MTITRSQVESALVARCGKRMALVEFAVTTGGDNADLNDPIATALLGMGLSVADISNPDATDLAAVENMEELLDRAELRLMENILGNLDTVDITVGQRSERLSQIAASIETAIERKRTAVENKYGDSGALTPGLVTLNFASKGDDVTV